MGTTNPVGPVSGKQAEQAMMWLRWAEADYLGSRMLLLAGLVVPGTVLANTTIEKHLKSVFAYSGMKIPDSHDSAVLYAQLTHKHPGDLALNPSFLRMLGKAYKLRYPDELNDGFNISLNQVKTLTQLDRSVLEITKRFVMASAGAPIPMVLERAARENDMRFIANNVALNPLQAANLFLKPSHCYDLRNNKGVVLEAMYVAHNLTDDSVFEVDGLVPLSDKQFKFGYAPIVTPHDPTLHSATAI